MSFGSKLSAVVALGLFGAVSTAQAAPTYFNDQSSFDAATNNTLVEDFLDYSDGATDDLGNTFSNNGITYTRLTGTVVTQKLLIVENNPSFGPAGLISHVLTDNRSDHWRMDFSSPSRAVGFDTYLNFNAQANISIFDTSSNLIDTFSHTHAASIVGFFGVLADQDIGSIIWQTAGGNIENTGLTNILQGTAVPAPGALALLGFGLIGLVGRRRTA